MTDDDDDDVEEEELDRRLEVDGEECVPLKLTEWMDVVDAVVLLDAPPPPVAPPPLSTPQETLRILLIPLELVQLIVLLCVMATELALCTIPSFVPSGRNNTTRV